MSKLDWARKKLADMEEREKGGGGGKFLNLEDGENFVRILPSWKGEDEPFYTEGRLHYAVGPNKKVVHCLELTGKKCFICEKARAMRKSGDEAGSGRIRAKARYYVNAVNLLDTDAGVQTFGFGAMIYKQLLRYLVDEEWGEWWIKKTRYDFKIKKSGQELSTEYVVFPTRKHKDTDTSELEPLDLEALAGKPYTYAQQEAIYDGEDPDSVPTAEEDEESDVEEDEEEAPAKPTKKAVKKPVVEEDEEEAPEEDAEEEAAEEDAEEDAEGEEEAAEEDAEEPAEESEADAPPSCFKDPMEHNPSDDICKDCDWFKDCGKAVAKLIAANPKKYAKAPLAQEAEEPDEEPEEAEEEEEEAPKKRGPGRPKKVEEELKKAVKRGPGRPKGTGKKAKR